MPNHASGPSGRPAGSPGPSEANGTADDFFDTFTVKSKPEPKPAPPKADFFDSFTVKSSGTTDTKPATSDGADFFDNFSVPAKPAAAAVDDGFFDSFSVKADLKASHRGYGYEDDEEDAEPPLPDDLDAGAEALVIEVGLELPGGDESGPTGGVIRRVAALQTLARRTSNDDWDSSSEWDNVTPNSMHVASEHSLAEHLKLGIGNVEAPPPPPPPFSADGTGAFDMFGGAHSSAALTDDPTRVRGRSAAANQRGAGPGALSAGGPAIPNAAAEIAAEYEAELAAANNPLPPPPTKDTPTHTDEDFFGATLMGFARLPAEDDTAADLPAVSDTTTNPSPTASSPFATPPAPSEDAPPPQFPDDDAADGDAGGGVGADSSADEDYYGGTLEVSRQSLLDAPTRVDWPRPELLDTRERRDEVVVEAEDFEVSGAPETISQLARALREAALPSDSDDARSDYHHHYPEEATPALPPPSVGRSRVSLPIPPTETSLEFESLEEIEFEASEADAIRQAAAANTLEFATPTDAPPSGPAADDEASVSTLRAADMHAPTESQVLKVLAGISGKDRQSQLEQEVYILREKFGQLQKSYDRVRAAVRKAKSYQQQMLPPPPRLASVEFDVLYKPAEHVSGDFYDFVPLDETRMGVTIGDISGHGIAPALIMTVAKKLMHVFLKQGLSPRDALIETNRNIFNDLPRSTILTATAGIIDTESKTFEFARAGHPAFALLNSAVRGPKPMRPNPAGMALGMDDGDVFARTLQTQVIELEPGDLVVLFSDGAFELAAKDGSRFGEQRFIDLLSEFSTSTVHFLMRKINSTIQHFRAGTQQDDDLSVIAFRVLSAQSHETRLRRKS